MRNPSNRERRCQELPGIVRGIEAERDYMYANIRTLRAEKMRLFDVYQNIAAEYDRIKREHAVAISGQLAPPPIGSGFGVMASVLELRMKKLEHEKGKAFGRYEEKKSVEKYYSKVGDNLQLKVQEYTAEARRLRCPVAYP